MNKQAEQRLISALQAKFTKTPIMKREVIQSLWSGYGEIARYRIGNNNVVVKVVDPTVQSTHPRGWNTSMSHQRKLDSYQNEQRFYSQFSSLTDSYCRVPDLLASGKVGEMTYLVMQDLDALQFTQRCDSANLSIAKKGVRWLAYFHARFINQDIQPLWPVGTYWHLATRPDEYSKMKEGPLKHHAVTIDTTLNQAHWQTLIHGDAKLANFCFTANYDDLAAVDFQYVGRGTGIKDLIYFLGSCWDNNELFGHADTMLDVYFGHLQDAIGHYQVECDFDALQQEWRDLYPFAWADFQRFLMGWASEHYKLNGYMQTQTNRALSVLKD